MAEIKIEKKKKGTSWIWAIPVTLVALVFMLWLFNNKEETTENEAVKISAVQNDISDETEKKIAVFTSYTRDDDNSMGIHHEYTHDSFTLLANAIESTAKDANVNLNANLNRIREIGDNLRDKPYSLNHANMIKEGFGIAENAFEQLKKTSPVSSDIDLSELRIYADKLDSGIETLDQRNLVKGFFNQSASIIEQIKNNLK